LLCGVEGVAEGSRPKYDAAEMDPNDREGSMKRVSSIAAVALLPLALASSVNAANERSLFALRSFIGLWESIGALHSITCSSDRTCELVGSVLRGTACRGESASVAGTGHLEGDDLVFPDVVITCQDGTVFDFEISYERDPFNRTLVGTAVVGGTTSRSEVFHKISK
jgi:hypothetical protein